MKTYLRIIAFVSVILFSISLMSLAFANSIIIPEIVQNNQNSYLETRYNTEIGKIASYRPKTPELPEVSISLIKITTDIETYISSDISTNSQKLHLIETKTKEEAYTYDSFDYRNGILSPVKNIIFPVSNSLIEKITIYAS